MATVRVEQPHSLSVDEARSALDAFAADIAKFGMKLDWNGPRAGLKGTGASGDVTIEADKVVVNVKLGLLAKAAGVDAGRLQGSIGRRLAAALSGPSA